MRRPYVERDDFWGDLINLLAFRPVYRKKKTFVEENFVQVIYDENGIDTGFRVHWSNGNPTGLVTYEDPDGE